MVYWEIVHCMWIKLTEKTTIKNALFTLPQGGVDYKKNVFT